MKSSERPLETTTDSEATWAKGVVPPHKEEQAGGGERTREGRAVPWCQASELGRWLLCRAGCKLTEPGGCLTADSVMVT